MQQNKQIKSITQKVSLKLTKRKFVDPFLTGHTKKSIINPLVMPYLHYCSLAWASAVPSWLNHVDKNSS